MAGKRIAVSKIRLSEISPARATKTIRPIMKKPDRTKPVPRSAFGVAQAQDFCTSIEYLIDQSRSDLADIADQPKGDTGDQAITLTLPGASYCTVTKQSKYNWYHCGWEFPHRAKREIGRAHV